MDDLLSQILTSRDVGVVHCGLSKQPAPSLAELAQEFGLSANVAIYREIDAPYALRILQMILHQDLAYDGEIMPAPQALTLAEKFLAQFDLERSRFYTNGNFFQTPGENRLVLEPHGPRPPPPRSTPAC